MAGVPDYWRFYEDRKWNRDQNKYPAGWNYEMRDTSIMQEYFPNGANTDELKMYWDYNTEQEWCDLVGGCPNF